MSEKETPEINEEQTQEAEISEELEEVQASEASEEIAKEQATEETETNKVETSEELDALEGDPEEVKAEELENEPVKEAPAVKKGLMERRSSFSQSSVPNAQKGHSGSPPIIMLLILSVFLLLSIIFATAAIGS